MSRTAKKGLTFWRKDAGHIRHKKIRLLVNEFDSDGYWIWSCILDKAYETTGYYLDIKDKDGLELFASEDCKKKVNLVKEVIDGCLRRGLFDKTVYELFGVLTCDYMQEVFLYATYDRRKKGSEFTMNKDWLLIDPEKYNTVNLSITTGSSDNSSRGRKRIPPGRNAAKETETKRNGNEKVAADKPPPSVKKIIGVDDQPEPYWQNIVNAWFAFNKNNFGEDPSFLRDDPKILKRIIGRLKTRAAAANVEWTNEAALKRFQAFLDKAFADRWLAENYLLSNLEKQFDKFELNQQKNGTHKQDAGRSAGATAKSAGATKLLDQLREEIGGV
jgi:hypothetical protein